MRHQWENDMRDHALYICLNALFGFEADTALRFSSDLEQRGISSHFLAFPSQAKKIRAQGGSVSELGLRKSENCRLVKEVCQTLRPRWIFVADAITLNCWFGPSHLFDVGWISDGSEGSQVITFDHFGLSLKEALVPICDHPDVEPKFKWLRATLPAEIALVAIPCPFGFPTVHPSSEGRHGLWFFRGEPLMRREESLAAAFRTSIGLGEQEKLILLEVSGWPLQIAQAFTENLGEWMAHLARGVEILFQTIRGTATIIVVSPYPLFPVPTRLGDLRFINLDLIPDEIFLSCLLSSDLFVTTNAFSRSLIHAAISGTPAALFVPRGRDDCTGPVFSQEYLSWCNNTMERFSELMRPCYVFPLGWEEIVSPHLRENPFFSFIGLLDLGNPDEIADTLNSLLSGHKSQQAREQLRLEYLKELALLPKPHELLERLK